MDRTSLLHIRTNESNEKVEFRWMEPANCIFFFYILILMTLLDETCTFHADECNENDKMKRMESSNCRWRQYAFLNLSILIPVFVLHFSYWREQWILVKIKSDISKLQRTYVFNLSILITCFCRWDVHFRQARAMKITEKLRERNQLTADDVYILLLILSNTNRF